MIDVLIKVTEQLMALLEISRTQRRTLLLEVIAPIYQDLEEIHREYLVVLSSARERCFSNPRSMKEVLVELQGKRILKEPERQKIIATCDRLLARKWRPEVKQFLLAVREYFNLGPPLAGLVRPMDNSRDEILFSIRAFSGYSRVISVLKLIVGQQNNSKVGQHELLAIFDETLDLLRAAWSSVSGDFAEIKAKSV